jgi:hypothetical protein
VYQLEESARQASEGHIVFLDRGAVGDTLFAIQNFNVSVFILVLFFPTRVHTRAHTQARKRGRYVVYCKWPVNDKQRDVTC